MEHLPTMTSLRKFIIAAGLAVSTLLLTSCNTTKGVGKDIERAGEKIQDKASR
jgi:predicted small secreted protein